MTAGRPKIEIDYDLVEKLASIMCTEEEIATMFNCSVRTLQRDEEFCRLFKKGKENGKMSLRRMQWKLADKNTSMAIFLGKQYLGQKDVVENTNIEKVDNITPLINMLSNKEEKDEPNN